MLHEQALLHLEELLNDPRYLDLIPHQKGNSIRIGKYVIRENKSGFLIYDCEINKKLNSTHSKSAALALVKGWQENRKNQSEVLRLDQIVRKYENDSTFYKHTMKITKDATKRLTTETRLDIATTEIYNAKSQLMSMLFLD
tara:strand:- start:882 stop:1304 length:423 start_codon:yes stop_codon:yes gene_type:complete